MDGNEPSTDDGVTPMNGVATCGSEATYDPEAGTTPAVVWPASPDGEGGVAPVRAGAQATLARQRVGDNGMVVRATAETEGLVVTRGKLVHLRTMTRADLRCLSEWAEDPFLERMVGSEFLHAYKHAYDKAPSFYDACASDPTQIVLVVMANDGSPRPLGAARLFNIHMLEGYAFLEVMLTDLRALRKGLGVEAGRLLSFYGVDTLGLRRIEAKVYAYNHLSINALKRNGFTHEGTLRKAGYQDGQYHDMLVFGILRGEIEEERMKDKIPLPPARGDDTPRDAP
jgi:RimJ/RimL family protein N-acetyltransferase